MSLSARVSFDILKLFPYHDGMTTKQRFRCSFIASNTDLAATNGDLNLSAGGSIVLLAVQHNR